MERTRIDASGTDLVYCKIKSRTYEEQVKDAVKQYLALLGEPSV